MLKIILLGTKIAYAEIVPNWPEVGVVPNLNPDFRILIWEILLGILALLIIFFFFKRSKNNEEKN